MFSQKKKNYAWLYVCGAIILAILAMLMVLGAVYSRSERASEQAGMTQPESVVSVPAETEDSVYGEEEDEEQEDVPQVEFSSSYYLVKLDKDKIMVYFSDETGNLTQLEETTIVYALLSTEDQERFQEGIRVSGRDELNRLIMDYES